MKRSKARALIQIYNAIADSGTTWAEIKHVGWTKLRAVARVLNKENAVYWIAVVKVSKGGVIETVKANLATSGGMNHESSTAAQVKTFKFLQDKVKTVQAASCRRRRHPTPRNDSVALEYLCLDYVGGCTLSRA